jgi:hypothetical protein
MTRMNEAQQVLANWIARASEGQLVEGVDPSQWAAENFINWWRTDIEGDITDAEAAIASARDELNRLGGWGNSQFGEALHELTHAKEAIENLRAKFGL